MSAGRFIIAVALITFSVVSAGVAEEMKTTLAFGLSVTDGNSETLQSNASIVSEGEKEGLGSTRFGIEANYGESTVAEVEETTVDNYKAFGNVKKTITDSTFAYVDATYINDDIAKVDYRATIGPGLGVYLIKSDDTKLSVELGASYVREDVADVSDDYTALRVSETFEHKLSEAAKIWQSAEYLPQADDFDNYLLTAEIGAEAALNSKMNLRVVLQDKYDSIPAADLEKNDITIIAGVGVKL